MDAHDFVGAYVRGHFADRGEEGGAVSAVLKEGRSDHEDPVTAMLEGSSFMVVLENGRGVVEAEGRQFNQYHWIREAPDDMAAGRGD